MKKLLGIVVLGLFWCNVVVAANYEELLTKAKTENNKEAIEVMDEAILGLEFENGFLEDCISEIKYLKKWGDSCKKVKSRLDGQMNLMDVLDNANLINNLLEIGKKIDKGKKLDFDRFRT